MRQARQTAFVRAGACGCAKLRESGSQAHALAASAVADKGWRPFGEAKPSLAPWTDMIVSLTTRGNGHIRSARHSPDP